MRVGVTRETAPGERRVALVPETAGKLTAAGFDVVVERGAGDAASFPDSAYDEAGASIGEAWSADLLAKVRKPDEQETAPLAGGQPLIGLARPPSETAGKLTAAGFDVVVERGAGDAASFPDSAYDEAGASIGEAWSADLLAKVRKPDEQETARLHDGQLLIGFLDPLSDPAGIERIAA